MQGVRRNGSDVARGLQPRRGMGTVNKSKTKNSSVTTTDVTELLASQHAEIDALIEVIQNEEGDVAMLFSDLADKIAAHTIVEEQLFYPAVMAFETGPVLHLAVEEHLEIKRILADLLETDIGTDEWIAKLSVLKQDVSHHAHDEEEDKLFPIVRQLMSADELAALGNEVLTMFEQLATQHPAMNVPGETEQAAPLPPVV